MDQDIEARVAHVMKYINKQWPQVAPQIPDKIMLFDHGFGRGTGICTTPGIIEDDWITSYGSTVFTDATVPESFFCLGIQNRGGSEYLFIMWVRNGRRFWFYDQYVVYVGEGFPASVKRTSERIDRAFERWDKTDGNVLYSGIGDQFN